MGETTLTSTGDFARFRNHQQIGLNLLSQGVDAASALETLLLAIPELCQQTHNKRIGSPDGRIFFGFTRTGHRLCGPYCRVEVTAIDGCDGFVYREPYCPVAAAC